MKRFPAAEFKTHCLKVMNDIHSKGYEVVITKRGKPLVTISPINETEKADIFGCMADTAIFAQEHKIRAQMDADLDQHVYHETLHDKSHLSNAATVSEPLESALLDQSDKEDVWVNKASAAKNISGYGSREHAEALSEEIDTNLPDRMHDEIANTQNLLQNTQNMHKELYVPKQYDLPSNAPYRDYSGIHESHYEEKNYFANVAYDDEIFAFGEEQTKGKIKTLPSDSPPKEASSSIKNPTKEEMFASKEMDNGSTNLSLSKKTEEPSFAMTKTQQLLSALDKKLQTTFSQSKPSAKENDSSLEDVPQINDDMMGDDDSI